MKRDVFGKSVKCRDIFGLRISSGSEFGKKPITFIDTETHTREWVGLHTILYFINQLVENLTVTNELLDYVIVPIVNPDGFKFNFSANLLGTPEPLHYQYLKYNTI